LQDVLGRELNKIYIIGGGSRNEILNRFTAEATGVPVIAGMPEATSLGNIMMQLIALGEVGSLSESREIIRRSFRMKTFQAEASADWDGAYERFVKVVEEREPSRK
jgi:rhamnulokinase